MNTLYTLVKEQIFQNLTVTASFADGTTADYPVTGEEKTEKGLLLSMGDAVKMEVVLTESAVILRIDASSGKPFASESALSLRFGTLQPDALLGNTHASDFWMMPSHPKTFDAIPARTQTLLIKKNSVIYALVPLCGDNFWCEMAEGALRISSGVDDQCRLSGSFLAVSASTAAVHALRFAYESARAEGDLRVPLRRERKLPEMFHGLGFCTWDAFKIDVCSEKIYAKLEEIRSKNLPFKWILIDDGWQTMEGRSLMLDFPVNPEKFPEGLKETVRKCKEEYGMEQVGIWHTFQIHWDGIKEGTALHERMKEDLIKLPCGVISPSLEEEKAYDLWNTFHTYLDESGIDFVKVDNQSTYPVRLKGVVPTIEGVRTNHRAMERSIAEHFDGRVINCMGMDMQNVESRPYSAVSRNSDDFFPQAKRGFIKHVTQNVYNAMWHGEIHFCDFDMWWSQHESAVQSGVLRAISGSPVYVSDALGGTDPEHLLPLLGSDGLLMLCDEAARPTENCVFCDCQAEKRLLSVWNRSGENFALATFNVSDGDVTDTIDFGSIPELSKETEYVAYEYFTKTYQRVNYTTDFLLTLPMDGVAVWSLYPIRTEDGDDEKEYIEMGSTECYVPIAAKDKKKVALSELSFSELA